MNHPVCETCGTQFDAELPLPSVCPVCADDRQYVDRAGQRWTTHDALLRRLHPRIEDDEGLLGLGIAEPFAIPQRALLLPTEAGNLLWECTALAAPEAIDALRQRGGVHWIAISHPHFYATMVEWSEALGGVPILLHAADRAWVRRASPHVRWWDGARLELGGTLSLVHTGGHFPGSTAAHWAAAPGGPLLCPGDSPQVAADRRHLSFMHSYPNQHPLRTSEVLALRRRLEGLPVERIHGFTWGRNIPGDGRAALERSFERHLHAVTH